MSPMTSSPSPIWIPNFLHHHVYLHRQNPSASIDTPSEQNNPNTEHISGMRVGGVLNSINYVDMENKNHNDMMNNI